MLVKVLCAIDRSWLGIYPTGHIKVGHLSHRWWSLSFSTDVLILIWPYLTSLIYTNHNCSFMRGQHFVVHVPLLPLTSAQMFASIRTVCAAAASHTLSWGWIAYRIYGGCQQLGHYECWLRPFISAVLLPPVWLCLVPICLLLQLACSLGSPQPVGRQKMSHN